MRKSRILGLVVLGIGAVALIGAAAVWLTNDIRLMGVGVLPVGVTAAAAVAFYEMRETRRIQRHEADRSNGNGRTDTKTRPAA